MSRKTFIAMAVAGLFLFAFGVGGQAANGKSTVAVLDFESIGSEQYLGKAVAEIMRTELVGSKEFRVVERSQINKAIAEQKLQMLGIIDDQNAVELGKLVGADFIVVGSVVKLGDAYTINSRMIDVKTGEAKLGRNVTGNDVDLLTTMSRTLIGALFGTEKGQIEEISEEITGEKDLHRERSNINDNGKRLGLWTGTWITNFKQLVLIQTGNRVTGHYAHDNGRIDGNVSGSTLRGTWSEEPSYRPPKDAGDFQFTLSSDGRSFTGKWRYGSSGDWREWMGTRHDSD